ncbi:prominin-1 isoform X2 [Venturia canescens]|uniref:prominin-1 isoform X2 n=1 Tax=Venturia canescens TaxID=32260 RepID=UPI001C9CD210|nr:prominin-1 isoform X2 [Venturia canescens]
MEAINQGILLLLVVGSLDAISLDQQDPLDFPILPESSTTQCNCTTTESPLLFLHPPDDNEANAHRILDGGNDDVVVYDDFRSNDGLKNNDDTTRYTDTGNDDVKKSNEDMRHNNDYGNSDENGSNDETYGAIPTTAAVDNRGTNMSHLKTLRVPENSDNAKPTLDFPKTPPDERYKMAALHLDKGLFAFDFLQPFLSIIQPNDVPPDLMRDVVENRITAYKLVSESLHMEVGFVALVGVCCILACVIPGTELWLACRPIRGDYKPSQHPGFLAFLLTVSVFILGTGMVAILVSNEASSSGIEKIPLVVETALQDLSDYHSGTTVQMRRCLTRSLDVASEAILADLDNVEELLGKPVQLDLATETGLDVALDALLDVANATQELASRTKTLLKEGEKASEQGSILSREMDNLKRELENAIRDCPMQDRQLCATLNPSGFGIALRLDRLLRDDRLLRLRDTARDNLTEAGRQSRGEYLYVPHHVARNTLDVRNRVRREISSIRARIFDEARSIESSGSELTRHLESTRRLTNYVIPYITSFEQTRWLAGIGTIFAIFLVWVLLVGALCCRCSSSEHRVRSTLLCGVLTSCFVSVGLWAILISALAVSSHTEMLLCRPLHDPNFRTLETLLESKTFLGRRLSFTLKDLFEKCQENEAAYPAFQLGNSMKLEQLTAHWSWAGLSSSMSKLKVDLKGLKIFTPNLQEKLQILLYACGPNLTDHKNTVSSKIAVENFENFVIFVIKKFFLCATFKRFHRFRCVNNLLFIMNFFLSRRIVHHSIFCVNFLRE